MKYLSKINNKNKKKWKMASRMSMDEKKKILNCHLPFVNRMIAKATGTKFETKWNNMKDSIVLESKLAKYATLKNN